MKIEFRFDKTVSVLFAFTHSFYFVVGKLLVNILIILMFHIHNDLINRLRKDKQDRWLCYKAIDSIVCYLGGTSTIYSEFGF